MKQRLRLFKKAKNGIYFIEDTETKKQNSLRTKDKLEAERLFAARRESLFQPAAVNVQLARTLLLAGDPTIRSGILAANGGFVSSPNALLNCALAGATAGTNYGQLQVAGAVTLNGTLGVDLLPGFSPATNDTFTVVTASTLNGAFARFTHPSNVVTMQLSNTPNSVIVRVNGFAVPELLLLPPVITGSNVLLC